MSITNTVDLLRYFKNKLIDFLNELCELLPKEADLICLRIMFENQIPIEEAMKIFAKRIMPYKDLVLAKDEKFFLDCGDLFAGIKKEKVSYFKELWLSKDLSQQNREALWKWFQLFLKIAIKYSEMTQ